MWWRRVANERRITASLASSLSSLRTAAAAAAAAAAAKSSSYWLFSVMQHFSVTSRRAVVHVTLG